MFALRAKFVDFSCQIFAQRLLSASVYSDVMLTVTCLVFV